MAQAASANTLLQNAMNELLLKEKDISTDIKGKDYLMVAPRLQMLRKHFGTRACLNSEIIENTATRVVMKATIHIDGIFVATGSAEEFRAIGHINRTSALMNCETSCWGRCLTNLGLTNDKIASAEEMKNAKETETMLKNSNQEHTGLALVRELVTYDSVIQKIKNASHTESLKAVISQPEIKEFLKSLKVNDPKKMRAVDAAYQKVQQQLTEGKTQ
tara:strand:- start:4010 stop:4660 length:651 start_codon:yes stop_codon:yes gene_type:complete